MRLKTISSSILRGHLSPSPLIQRISQMCGLFALEGSPADSKLIQAEIPHLRHRGPDDVETAMNSDFTFVFHRLAIMDLSAKGNQPFEDENCVVMCNGEIYNYKQLKKQYSQYAYKSNSDCEVLVPLFADKKELLAKELDAEFACVIFDKHTRNLFAARDPIGIRPLFYGYQKNGNIAFASEIKSLQSYCQEIHPFPPGHYYWKGKIQSYLDVTDVTPIEQTDTQIAEGIRSKLIEGVRKRLDSDAPIGFLLSGGLDSSLVCAIAAKILKKPLITFATGINTDPIDTRYAKIVADHIGSIHHEVLFTKEDVLNSLDKVIWHLETWDITTIRASIGMYLVCKYIRENTNVKVVMTGEISDELFGYKYTDFAPSAEEFQKEAVKRVRELYMYDVLRADRSISANSLEARVPFGDLDFVKYVMSLDPAKKLKQAGKMGKYLLRNAFESSANHPDTLLDAQKPLLPHEILWREKAAFSDAVGHSMVDHLKAYAETAVSEADLKEAQTKYPHGTPFTKESLLYRNIFESHYPGQAHTIKDFWMPNRTWPGCEVNDPSARVLKNYGKSGE